MSDAELRAYNPTWRDRIAAWLIGDGRQPAYRRQVVTGILGSAGLGNEGASVVDFTPAGAVFAGDEAIRAAQDGDYAGAGLSALGAVPTGVVVAGTRAVRGAARGMAPQGARGAGILAMRPPVEHYPPRMPERPFEADYPNGAKIDDAGRLTESIHGRPLTATFVAGRRYENMPDTNFARASEDLGRIARGILGTYPRLSETGEIGADVAGALVYNLETYAPKEILINTSTHPGDYPRVLSHEIGHAIDLSLGRPAIPDGPSREQLMRNYDVMAVERPGEARPYTPETLGYPGDQTDEELIAEGISSYLMDPNYFKTVAPDAAAHFRSFNEHPAIRDILQFNTFFPFLVPGLVNGREPDPKPSLDDRFGALYRAGLAT